MRSAITKSIKTYFYIRNSFCFKVFNAFQRKIIKLRSSLSNIELSINEKKMITIMRHFIGIYFKKFNMRQFILV